MNLQQFLRILRARWVLILVTMAVIVGSTIGISLLLPQRYTATASVVIDMKGIDPITGAVLPVMIPASGYIATQVDIISSYNVARKAVDMLRLVENPSVKQLFENKAQGRGSIRDWVAELLLEDLKVIPSRESSVVNISYKGADPRFAAAVANAFVRGYINTTLELKVQPARHTTEFFSDQIKGLKVSLEKAQTELSQFQREKGIVATDERFDVENGRLNELSTQLVAAQAQTFDSVSRQRQVQEVLAKGEIPENLPDVLANPVIQSLKASLTQLDAKLNDLSSKLGKNHPQYESVLAEISGVRKKLDEEMRIIGKTLGNAAILAQKREDQIKAALAAQRTKVLDVKKQRDEVAMLMREVENAQRSFDAGSQRLTTTKIESQTTQTNVMVVNEAVEPIEHSSPKVLLNTIVSIVLGLFIAIALALVRELFDRVVRSPDDAAAALGIPVLGVIAPHSARGLRFRRKASPGVGPVSQGGLGAS